MGFSAHFILNLASGSAAAFRESLTEAARERGIRVRVLEYGQDARLAAFAAVEDGAESLAVAGDDGRWLGWPPSATYPSWSYPRVRSTTSPATSG